MEKFYKAAPCTEDDLKGSGYRYQKAKGKIEFDPKKERDEDGFFLPTTEGAARHYGIMCAVLGVTPLNRKSDLEQSIDNLMKEAYEHDIQGMMFDVRLAEFNLLQKFAAEDEEEESAQGMNPYRREKVPTVKNGKRHYDPAIVYTDERRRLVDAVTWKYKWIQLYKKPCFLFAQYTIEELRNWNGMKRFLKMLTQEQREFVFASKAAYDSGSRKCVFHGEPKSDEEKLVRLHASLYWREHELHMERQRFREEFIHSYNRLPMANRHLMDVMYEVAWCNISFYKYGKKPGHIPAPWYDREDAEDRDGKTEEGDNT